MDSRKNERHEMIDRDLPEQIRKMVEGKTYESDEVGCSDSQVRIYDEFVLKIEKEKEKLADMVRTMQWLEGKLPAPRVLYTEVKDGIRYLVMSKVKGRMACDPYYMTRPKELLQLLADSLKLLWSVDISDCPFRDEGKDIDNAVLSHGDFCLPNILADNSSITGFLDWGYCTVSSKQADIDTCIESLENNLTGCFSDGTQELPLDRRTFEELLK